MNVAEKKSIDILADRVDRLACSKCGHHMDLAEVDPFTEIVCPKCQFKQVAPMRLGSFLLIAEMGKGGMGSVYRAFDQTLGRYVAIKVMQKKLAADKTFAENFVREARAAAALNHPHVVQIYSCSQEKGQLYIVMELVDGGRMDKMMEGGKQLDEVVTLEVGVQVAQGLLAASDIGLIHGDIKPANILFDKQKRAKVVDFGLARFAAQQHLQPGEIWGTPYYIAPEKVRSQKEDLRADIYSLGATLYHALAGEPPFDGETAKEVVLARLKNPAKGLRTVRPTLQPETADVIARTLESDPSHRYPTYKSLLADMEEALRVARQRHGMPPPDESRSSKLPWVIGGVVVAAMIGGAVYWFGGEEEPDPAPAPPRHIADPTPEVAPPTPPPDPEIVFAEQPFPEEVQEQIEAAITHWISGNIADYEAAMDDLFRAMPRLGVERPWVGVLQALPAWQEQRDRDVERYLRGVPDAQLRDLGEGVAHPGAMPQGVGRFMLGRIEDQDLQQVARAWPESEWFAEWLHFIRAIHYLRRGWINEAEELLGEYIDLSAGDVRWPYYFQPLAQQWLAPIRHWRALEQSVAEQEPEEALQTLQDYRREVRDVTYLHGAIDDQIQQVQNLIREAEAEKAREAEQAQQARIDQDVARIQSAREEVRSLVQRRDFRRASTRFRQLAMPLETDEGRALMQEQIQKYNRLEELRSFLIEQIQRRPAPVQISPELRGQTDGATSTRINVSLGAHASMPLEWHDVSDRVFANWVDFYISDKADSEQAEHLLSVALMLYEVGALRPARIYADRATTLNRRLRATVNEWMPDLNQDE